MIEQEDIIITVLWLVVAAVSLVPFILFFISYMRVRSTKLLITTIAFLLFFIKAMTLAMELFIPDYLDEISGSVAAILDLIIIGLIAFALLKKD